MLMDRLFGPINRTREELEVLFDSTPPGRAIPCSDAEYELLMKISEERFVRSMKNGNIIYMSPCDQNTW